jgi:fumarylacetoacetate (FAA) hydrolase family protein
MTQLATAVQPALPADIATASLAGRVWRPDAAGPSVVTVREGMLLDVTRHFPTVRGARSGDRVAGGGR